MPQIRPRQILPLSALKFGTAVSDRVDCGSDTSLDNLPLNPWSGLMLIYPTALTSSKTYSSKGSLGFILKTTGATGNFSFLCARVTTATEYQTSDTPFAKINQWYWLAWNYDSSLGVGEKFKIFAGALTGSLSRRTVTVTTEGVGTAKDDSAAVFQWMNETAINNSAPVSSLAMAALWNRSIPHEEFIRLTKGGGAGFRESNPVGLWRVGWQSRCVDESGNPNHGTITGAVLSGARAVL